MPKFGSGFLSTITIFFMFMSSASIRADYTALISPSSVLVTNFQGWGTSLCWWANVVGGYPNRTNYIDLAYNQLKLNIARYNIGGGENPTNHFLAYRAQMQGFEPTNGVWNWNADLNQRWVLQAALAHGVNLVDAFANSPPWWMTVSGSVTGAAGATNNLQVADQSLFATYLATVVSNLVVLDGDHFNYVTPMNEPNGSKWTYGGSQEGCDISQTQQPAVVTTLRAELNTSLPSAGIDAAEDVDPYQSYSDLASYPSATINNIALFTTHTYSVTGSSSFSSEGNNYGKPKWVSEYGDSDSTGLTMAQRIHDDITGMGVRAWVYWQLVDNASGWGFLYNPLVASTSSSYTTNYTINQKFYVMGQFSEFVRPGCQIISVNDTNTLAAYNPTNSSLVLVTVNNSSTGFNITYNLSSFGSKPWQVTATRTSSGQNMVGLPTPVVANQIFTSAIPAKSVTTFVLTTNVAPPVIVNQFPSTETINLYPGETTTFSLSVTGSVPMYYRWTSNNVAIGGATNTSYTPPVNLLSNGTLSFDCIASNMAGMATSTVWSVTVVPAPTTSYPRAVLALYPIAYWRLNEPDQGNGNNGVVAEDSVGGYNGIYTNVALSQPGYSTLTEPAGTSALFGSIASANSDASQIQGLDFSKPAGSNAEYSIVAWVNGAGHTQNSNAGIVAKGYFNDEELDLDEGAPGADLRFVARSAAGTAYTANSTINIYTNSGWHHLVGICDEAKSNLLLYVDGTLAGNATIPPLSGITNSSYVPISIGSRASSATSGNNNQFFGLISDVAVFSYALNPNQVQTLYTSGISLPPAGLIITNISANQMQLNWSYGVLQSATNVSGPYNDISNAVQPYIAPTTNSQQFYRIREN